MFISAQQNNEGSVMIKETNQRIVKVYFKDESFWDSNGCDCCENTYMEVFNFSHIEGVDNPDEYHRMSGPGK